MRVRVIDMAAKLDLELDWPTMGARLERDLRAPGTETDPARYETEVAIRLAD